MARPIKNNAEYFSHDADMRNDLRIKAVRNKFGLEGYGIYCMLLEILTDSENFKFKYDELNIELVSADMGVDSSVFKTSVDYMIKIDLLQLADNNLYLTCRTLENRFSALLSKRKRQRIGVIDDDNPQNDTLSSAKIHKVKKSKVKERKIILRKRKIQKRKRKQLQKKLIPLWKKDFNEYQKLCKAEFEKYFYDDAFIKEQEYFHSNLDIDKTMQKAMLQYWITKDGWTNMKKRKGEIDWKRTIVNAINSKLNHVYKDRAEQSKLKF